MPHLTHSKIQHCAEKKERKEKQKETKRKRKTEQNIALCKIPVSEAIHEGTRFNVLQKHHSIWTQKSHSDLQRILQGRPLAFLAPPARLGDWQAPAGFAGGLSLQRLSSLVCL